jgi:hypothetical protein
LVAQIFSSLNPLTRWAGASCRRFVADWFPIRLRPSSSSRSSRRPGAAAIFDNLNIMNEVIAEVLVHPQVGDVHPAIREVVEHFTDRRYRVADPEDWGHDGAAAQHLRAGWTSARRDDGVGRNTSGHFQHTRRGGRAMPPGGVR